MPNCLGYCTPGWPPGSCWVQLLKLKPTARPPGSVLALPLTDFVILENLFNHRMPQLSHMAILLPILRALQGLNDLLDKKLRKSSSTCKQKGHVCGYRQVHSRTWALPTLNLLPSQSLNVLNSICSWALVQMLTVISFLPFFLIFHV